MPKNDLLKILKWIGYIYTPIVLLIIGIFLLVQYREYELSKLGDKTGPTQEKLSPVTKKP